MSKLIVFDVDGTFLNSYGLFERAVVEYSDKNGLPLPCLETIRFGYGHPYDHDFKWGVDRDEQVRHLFEVFKILDAKTKTGGDDWRPDLYDGVLETFEHLKDLGHTLAIVTAKPEEPLLHVLEYYKIHSYFSAHRTWDDIKRRNEKEKPAPDMLVSVMRELNFANDETVMIGDTTMDILMGRGAQSSTIGVTWGNHQKHHLEGAGAHYIVEKKFLDLVPAVMKVFAS